MYIEVPDVVEFSPGFGNPPDRANPGQGQIANSATQGRGQRILVVDDSLAWLHLARKILTAAGYQVHACKYPPDALSLLKENSQQFDLVITDLQMPCLDGIELAAELLKINSALPVVLTSAAEVEMTSEKLQSLGIRDFLSKPWEREQLFSIIRQAIGNRKQ
ncbi:MAG TPA: response regulator [Terriglobia bacterium]|nr:response regulator [Terriglobia bacterium]